MDFYWIVHLLDGRTVKFNKQCNIVDYDNDHLCRFAKRPRYGEAVILALIPYECIMMIERVEENNV